VAAEAPSDPPRRFLDSDVGRLAYTVEGDGPTTVIAIPGLPGSVRDYRWLAPLLAEHVTVVRLDLPGFGESPRAPHRAMSIDERADAVHAVVEARGLSRVTLLAHSSGSTPAVALAVRRRDLVSSVVLLAPTGPRSHYSRTAFTALAAGYSVPGLRLGAHAVVQRLFAAAGFPRSLSDAEREAAVLDAAALDFDQHAANLAALTQPTLLCWARDDPVIPSGIVADLVALVPHAQTLHLSSGGHNVQKTQARVIADAVVAFVRPHAEGGP
jgi:pimeloyl-ACP methyl ester carboxylesterase